MSESWGFNTKAVHAGQEADPATGAVTVPIYAVSTFQQTAIGEFPFTDYARVDNPTRSALQTALAALENAEFGYAFASGLAAEDAVLRSLSPGDHVIIGSDAYGGTFRLISKIFGDSGVKYTSVNFANEGELEKAFIPGSTKQVWLETPSNPTLQITDIAHIAQRVHDLGALLVVDNTFASPYVQQPLTLGADIVVHSTTKYIGGHSDVLGGFVATNNSEVAERVKFLQYAVGAIPSPFDAFLLLRGVKTLGVRMERHSQSAQVIAEELASHSAVEHVYYPGLSSHEGHDIASKQMRVFGGMVSFIVKGGAEAAKRVAESTSIFTLAESLGAVESLIEVPYLMSHASTQGTELEINPGLIRLSVGVEDVDDLLEDLTRALA